MAYYLPSSNVGNIVVTGIGLSLSGLTGYPLSTPAEVLDFILTNQNSKGIWNYSTDFLYCELIDTYHVLRSLSEAGALSQLSASEKDDIAMVIRDFQMYTGYSLLSEEYTSINLLYTLINTFDIYNRSSELNYQYLYSLIENSCIPELASNAEGFVSCMIFEPTYLTYRSFPYEYYYHGTHNYLSESDNSLITHKSAYMALDSLKILENMDEFEVNHDLSDLLQSIIDSQFLELGYDNYGGFLRFKSDLLGPPESQNSLVFIEYSYYAIKALELLSEYLGLGAVTNLAFDIQALNTYIHDKITEDLTMLYFNPQYTDNTAVLMENTYFAIYILKVINEYDLNEEKIKNFVFLIYTITLTHQKL